MVNKTLNNQGWRLHIIGTSVTKPSVACVMSDFVAQDGRLFQSKRKAEQVFIQSLQVLWSNYQRHLLPPKYLQISIRKPVLQIALTFILARHIGTRPVLIL